MNITYDYYRIFYFVAKYQSFTKAANILLSNEPNISRSIRNLEHEFGVSLFIRSNRGVTLTPEGQKLYTRVAAAHHQLSSAEAELADAKSLTSGTITLGVSEAALQILLLPKLREFHQRISGDQDPHFQRDNASGRLFLKSGLVDLAIVTSPTGVTRPLKEIPLRPIREVLIGGPRFASLSGTPKTLKELADYPFILLNSQTNAHDFYLHFFSEHGISIKPDIEVVTTDQILPMIKYDLGIGFCRSSSRWTHS
ncbi:MAG: LysR family transcriptional regulator [Lachnospiraceae bacterium]